MLTIPHGLAVCNSEAMANGGRTGDQLRGELLDAATRILAARLVTTSPSLRETARACGVSPTAVYRHFPSQHSLMVAVARRALLSLQNAIEQATQPSQGDQLTLRHVSWAYVSWAMSNPGAYQLLFEGRPGLADAEDVDVAIEELQKQLIALTKPLMKRTVNLNGQADRLWVALHGLVSLRMRKPSQEWSRPIRHETLAIVDTFFPDI